MRIERIIRETVDRLALDLGGMTVFTEAASGYYMFTPIVAALAGASVTAIARDSEYGRADDIGRELVERSTGLGVRDAITVVTEKRQEYVGRADIVTNSGFVRPIDREFVDMMKPDAVVALMFEAWELREEDIDVDACRRRGVRIAGVNEDHPSVDVFNFVGVLGFKMLLEAGIEVYGSRVGILSTDRFGRTLKDYLERCGAVVSMAANVQSLVDSSSLDAIIYADYDSSVRIDNSLAKPEASSPVVVQFLGGLDYAHLKSRGLRVHPDRPLAAKRMAQTFSELGPRPVIKLQAAGLKAAELVHRGELPGEGDRFHGLVQEVGA